jgi:hypothetical protein
VEGKKAGKMGGGCLGTEALWWEFCDGPETNQSCETFGFISSRSPWRSPCRSQLALKRGLQMLRRSCDQDSVGWPIV